MSLLIFSLLSLFFVPMVEEEDGWSFLMLSVVEFVAVYLFSVHCFSFFVREAFLFFLWLIDYFMVATRPVSS